MKLTPALLSSLQPGQPLSSLKAVELPERGFTSVEDISAATDLRRIDLHGNRLRNAEAINGLRYCTGITWLHLGSNEYANVCPPGNVLEKMSGLRGGV
jgi:hypothetical protein